MFLGISVFSSLSTLEWTWLAFPKMIHILLLAKKFTDIDVRRDVKYGLKHDAAAAATAGGPHLFF